MSCCESIQYSIFYKCIATYFGQTWISDTGKILQDLNLIADNKQLYLSVVYFYQKHCGTKKNWVGMLYLYRSINNESPWTYMIPRKSSMIVKEK